MDLPTRKLEDKQMYTCISTTICRIYMVSERCYMNWGTALWTSMRMTDTLWNGFSPPVTLCTSWVILYKPFQCYTARDTIFVPWPVVQIIVTILASRLLYYKEKERERIKRYMKLHMRSWCYFCFKLGKL